MNQTGTLTVEGYEPADKKITLQVGWNLVGYLSTNKTLPLANALSSINGKYTKVGAWINNTGKHYISGFPFNTLSNMSEGYGYWIKMNSTGVLEYTYNKSS